MFLLSLLIFTPPKNIALVDLIFLEKLAREVEKKKLLVFTLFWASEILFDWVH